MRNCLFQVYIKLFDDPLQSDSTTEETDIGEFLSTFNVQTSLTFFLLPPLENLSPAELKKLRNKQRKAKKKAELENAQAAKAEKKKEQYNKSRQQQNQDGDPEAPVLDELIPEKLERTEDPLGKAIELLKPLQLLSKGLIETHLLTFEIYYRKNKLLIMLQALKRAFAIDPNNATLHGCIVRFIKLLDKQMSQANEFVRTVIQNEMKTELPIIGKKSGELNSEFIAKNKDSAEALIAGARVYYDDGNKTKAIELLMSCTHLKSFTLPVSFLRNLNLPSNSSTRFHSTARSARLHTLQVGRFRRLRSRQGKVPRTNPRSVPHCRGLQATER